MARTKQTRPSAPTGYPAPYEDSGVEDFECDDGESYTWSADTTYEYTLLAYCIGEAIRELDKRMFTFQGKSYGEFTYDLDKNKQIKQAGFSSFTYKKHNHIWDANDEHNCHTICSNTDISEVVKHIDGYIKDRNPLKRKSIQIQQRRDGFEVIFKKVPDVQFKDIILDEGVKQEIYDNTVFQLKNMDMNNGIILHGHQGTGKSFVCQAVIAESVKEGFGSCLVTTSLNFSYFGEFIRKWLSPCVVIFEDIDSFAKDRESVHNHELSEFLQLLSGVSDGNDRIIFIATTNYLEHLDKAVADRPMRFNRKYEFGFPSSLQIDSLVTKYFPGVELSATQRAMCHDCKFTGSHIKEIYRTAQLASIKTDTPIGENYDEAVAKVKESFKAKDDGKIGF